MDLLIFAKNKREKEELELSKDILNKSDNLNSLKENGYTCISYVLPINNVILSLLIS